MPSPFVHELRVRYGECDPQGIVFNANYLLYFDVAFTELWRAAVGPWQEMLSSGVDAVVSEANLDFRAPARFDDILALNARITRLGRTSVTTAIDVMRGEELLIAGWLRHVCVAAPIDPVAGASAVAWPAAILAGLAPFAVADT